MRKLIVCLALALPAAALANGYDVPSTNARDLGTASAMRADQVDANAVYANPAALARFRGLSLSLSGSLLDIRTKWNATNEALAPRSPERTLFHPAPPPSLFASYSDQIAGHGVGFGVGMNVVAGGNVFWPGDWAGRSRIITVDRKVYAFYGTAGVEIVKQLRIGGGAVWYRTTEDLVQGLDPLPSTVELGTSGGTLSWDAAAEITPFDDIPLTFAIDYKHQAVQKLTGTAHFDVPATLQPLLQDQSVTHVLPYPNMLNLAVAYRPMPELVLGFTYTFDRYVIYGEDRFVGDKPLPGPVIVPRNYGNGYTLRVGAEWMATPRLALRAGVLRDISGMPKQTGADGALLSPTYSPTLPDSNSWAGALGAGWSFARNFSVSGAVFYAHMDRVASSNNGPSPQTFPGRYQTYVLIYSLGLSYNWSPGESPGHLRPF